METPIDHKTIGSDVPKVHSLKTLPHFFRDVKDGVKPFDIRVKDRDFRVGDILVLKEWFLPADGAHCGAYTGRELRAHVTYIFDHATRLDGKHALKSGYVVMGIVLVNESYFKRLRDYLTLACMRFLMRCASHTKS